MKLVTLLVDAVMVLPVLTVPVVMKEHTSMTEVVELVHPLTTEMLMTGPVKNVLIHVVNAQDQMPLNVLIVAMKPPDYTYKLMDNVYTHAHPTIMLILMEHVNHATLHAKHAVVN